MVWLARGGEHTGDDPPAACEGSAYKADLNANGLIVLKKEQYHSQYASPDINSKLRTARRKMDRA